MVTARLLTRYLLQNSSRRCVFRDGLYYLSGYPMTPAEVSDMIAEEIVEGRL